MDQPVAYQLPLTNLSATLAAFTSDGVGLTLPVEAWAALGRPGFVEIVPTAVGIPARVFQ